MKNRISQQNSLTGKIIESSFCIAVANCNNYVVLVYSTFDGNHGGKGATIHIKFYKGRINNVTFNNNTGPVIRVSL